MPFSYRVRGYLEPHLPAAGAHVVLLRGLPGRAACRARSQWLAATSGAGGGARGGGADGLEVATGVALVAALLRKEGGGQGRAGEGGQDQREDRGGKNMLNYGP